MGEGSEDNHRGLKTNEVCVRCGVCVLIVSHGGVGVFVFVCRVQNLAQYELVVPLSLSLCVCVCVCVLKQMFKIGRILRAGGGGAATAPCAGGPAWIHYYLPAPRNVS